LGEFQANRLLITQGDQSNISYYWLKQGSKMFTQESLARLDLMRFALTEGRTDGALIRLVSYLEPGENEKDVDKRLSQFASQFVEKISEFVPD